jgi:VanZ family protein
MVAIAWMGAVIFFSLQPPSHGPDLFQHQDKVEHLIAYAVMAYLIGTSLLKTSSKFSRPVLFVTVVCWCGLYGLVLEIIQSHIRRDFSLLDELANIAGAVIGICVLRSGLIGKISARLFHSRR